MAKKRVVCPECGYSHIVEIRGMRGQVAGVRSRRVTENQFEHTINVPGEIVENERYYTLGHQLLAAGAVGISAGTLIGYFVSIPWHLSNPGLSAEIITSGALTGWTVSWSLLTKERAWQLGKALPNAIHKYLELTNAKTPTNDNGINLTVTNIETPQRKTINRFDGLSVSDETFNEWAQGALLGKSLAVANWTPKAKGFTRPEYDDLLKKMTEGKLVINLGSNKGNTLTPAGRRALNRHLIDCGIPPPPAQKNDDFLGERLAQAKANNGGNTPLPHPGVCVGDENG